MNGLLLALLLRSHTRDISDSEYADIFTDKGIKKLSKQALITLMIIIAVFIPLALYFQDRILLNILFIGVAGFAIILFPFGLYVYLRCVIAQWRRK